MKLSKRGWKRLIKAIGPLLLIFFLIKIVDPWAVADHLKNIRLNIFIAAFLFFPLLISIRTYRWWIICRQVNLGASFQSLFQITYISWFLSILPVTGVFAISKIVYLNEEGKSARTVAISIIIDKLSDILGLLFFGLFAIFSFHKIPIGESSIWILYGAITILLGLMIVFGKWLWRGFRNLLKRYMNQKMRAIGAGMEADLGRFWSEFSSKLTLQFFAFAIVIGLLRSLVLYVLALSINLHVTFALIVGCRALIGIVNVVPISISGLGTRDAVLLFILPFAGISNDAALALGLIAFLWGILFKLSGVVFWIKRPLPTAAITSIKGKLFPES